MVKNIKLYKRIYNEKSFLLSRFSVSDYYSLKATIIISSLFFLLYFIHTQITHINVYVTHTLFKEIQMNVYSNPLQLVTLYAHSK